MAQRVGHIVGAGKNAVVGAACAVVAMVLSGCGAGDYGQPGVLSTPSGAASQTADAPPATEKALAGELSFTYQKTQPEKETISQTLDIKNDDDKSLLPVLAFTPLDAHHHVLPQVKVSAVYGSDRGTLAVPYGYGYDILRFSGPGEHAVADVRVAVRSVRLAPHRAGIHEVEVQPLDASGAKVDKFSRFTALRLTDQDGFDVYVRVVYILWDQPTGDNSQQAVSATPVGGLIRVPAHGSTVVKVTGAAAKAVAQDAEGPAVSIKPYDSL